MRGCLFWWVGSRLLPLSHLLNMIDPKDKAKAEPFSSSGEGSNEDKINCVEIALDK